MLVKCVGNEAHITGCNRSRQRGGYRLVVLDPGKLCCPPEEDGFWQSSGAGSPEATGF